MQFSWNLPCMLISSLAISVYIRESDSLGLDPLSAAEGPCITLQNPAVVNLTWLNDTPRRWFFQFSSRYFTYILANALLGRQAADMAELTQMCLVDGYGTGAFGPMSRVFTGFGEAIYQKCALSSNNTVFECLSVIGSINANPSIINTETIQIAMTDNNSYLLMVSCFNGQHRNIQLVSPERNLSRFIIRQAHAKAKQLGFKDFILDLPCVGYAPQTP